MSTLDLGELRISYKLDKDGLKRDLREGETEIQASGNRSGRSILETALQWARNLVHGWGNAGHTASSAFWNAAAQRWTDASGRFISAAEAMGRQAGQGASSGLGIFSSALGMLGGALNKVQLDASTAAKIFLIFWGIIAALVPATQLLGGVLGALPALTTGGIAAVATLGLGFMGLSDAFKKTSSAGGSAVDRLRQVAMAERRMADANREVLASQEALNKARKTAAEKLQDLTRSLAGARLDEADAVDAVAKARADLDRAQEGGNADQIRAAERAMQRALQALAEAQDRTEDLAEEQDDASRKGVEGSDEVTAALDRQRRATEGIEDAIYDLKRAQQSGGAGGAAAEAMKIAASASAFVAAVKGLKGDFESLRLDIQERLFAGTDVEIKELWASWIPTLRTRLGSMASMFNGLFKSWATTSRKPEFIANIAAGWEGVEALIKRVFGAIAGPGLEAFGKLSRAARPMLDAIGDSLGGMVEKFGEWIEKAEKSGALKEFFEDAGQFFRDVMSIGGSAVRIIGSVIGILMNGTEKSRGDATKSFVVTMRDLADWFADPKNSAMIEGWFKKIEEFLYWVLETGIPTVKKWIEKIDEWADRIGGWIERARAFKDTMLETFNSITGAVFGMPGRIAAAASGMFDGIKNAFKSAINWVIGKWNALEFPAMSIGGVTLTSPLRTIDIPPLGDGGLVRATPGGRVVNVSEAGEDEIVSPVSQMRQIVGEELARFMAERGRDAIDIYVHDGEVVGLIEAKQREHDRQSKRSETAGAGRR